MDTTELIKSLKVCSDFSKSCADCHYQKCDSSCLSRILASAAERLEILSVALKIAREENTALIDDIKYVSDKHYGDACFICKFYDTEKECCVCTERCVGDKWEWRGVMPDE